MLSLRSPLFISQMLMEINNQLHFNPNNFFHIKALHLLDSLDIYIVEWYLFSVQYPFKGPNEGDCFDNTKLQQWYFLLDCCDVTFTGTPELDVMNLNRFQQFLRSSTLHLELLPCHF